jgi:hypothetical protein
MASRVERARKERERERRKREKEREGERERERERERESTDRERERAQTERAERESREGFRARRHPRLLFPLLSPPLLSTSPYLSISLSDSLASKAQCTASQ